MHPASRPSGRLGGLLRYSWRVLASPDLSIIVPVYDEAGNLAALQREICQAMAAVPQEFEVVLVDDGSQDGSFAEAARIAAADSRFRAVRLARNYGQTAAIQAGIDAAVGSVLVTMDADLQNDPADIPRLLAEFGRGFDVVCGWRKKRQGGLLRRRIPSWIANRLIRLLTGLGIHDHGCALKAFRRKVISRQPLYGELHRYLLVMMQLSGGRYCEVVVNDRPRLAGRSKYGLKRIWRVALDLLTLVMVQRYWTRPGLWFVLGGLPFVVLTAGLAAGSVHQYLTSAGPEPFWIVLSGALFLAVFGCLHFFLLAAIGELVVRSADRRPADYVAASSLDGQGRLDG